MRRAFSLPGATLLHHNIPLVPPWKRNITWPLSSTFRPGTNASRSAAGLSTSRPVMNRVRLCAWVQLSPVEPPAPERAASVRHLACLKVSSRVSHPHRTKRGCHTHDDPFGSPLGKDRGTVNGLAINLAAQHRDRSSACAPSAIDAAAMLSALAEASFKFFIGFPSRVSSAVCQKFAESSVLLQGCLRYAPHWKSG